MKFAPHAPRWLRRFAVFGVALGALCLVCDAWVEHAARGRCFRNIADVPAAPTALVLGCSEHLPDGRRNLYFTRRISAAAELFLAGKVRALIVSGDNHAVDYDEPTAMKAALVRAGVPAEIIYCDFAGFRTLDSIVRAKAVFGQKRVIVVSQRFHGKRAVYLARQNGLDAYGFDASPVGGASGWKSRARECLARTAAVLDVTVLRTQPKFLGPRVDVVVAELAPDGR